MNGPGADSVLLQARGVTKRFPGVVANDDITLAWTSAPSRT